MASTNMGPNEGGSGGMQPGDYDEGRRERRRGRIGLVLIVIGALALLSDLGIYRGLHNIVGMVIFAVLGGFVLSHYLSKRRIGSLIGAFVLFGLAAATVGGASAGFYFLALIGVGFAAVYYVDRSRWWAIIPAGTLFSLAVIAGLDSWAPGYDAGWILFAGLALTFGVLYQLPDDPKPWAVYPAIASVVLAVLGLSFGGTWLVPLLLVAVGVYLLVRQRGGEHRIGEGQVGAGGGAAEAAQASAPSGCAPESATGEARPQQPGATGGPGEEPPGNAGAGDGDDRQNG